MTPAAATAHDVSGISACHGNEFENSCQTSCQLRFILAAPVVLQHLRYPQKRKPAWLGWASLTAKDFKGILLVTRHQDIFFFLLPPPPPPMASEHFPSRFRRHPSYSSSRGNCLCNQIALAARSMQHFHFISSWRMINKSWEEAGAPWVFFSSSSCDESGSDVIMK